MYESICLPGCHINYSGIAVPEQSLEKKRCAICTMISVRSPCSASTNWSDCLGPQSVQQSQWKTVMKHWMLLKSKKKCILTSRSLNCPWTLCQKNLVFAPAAIQLNRFRWHVWHAWPWYKHTNDMSYRQNRHTDDATALDNITFIIPPLLYQLCHFLYTCLSDSLTIKVWFNGRHTEPCDDVWRSCCVFVRNMHQLGLGWPFAWSCNRDPAQCPRCVWVLSHCVWQQSRSRRDRVPQLITVPIQAWLYLG